MNRRFGMIISACATFLAMASASALDMKIAGNVVELRGSIVEGDDEKFRDLMNAAEGRKTRYVLLNSRGGKIDPAGQIGRVIRKRRMTTVADGRTVCSSACTVIFAGGSTRHYVNGERVRDGKVYSGFQSGLAYHQGHGAEGYYSEEETLKMIRYYREFGVRGASDLPDKAPPHWYWQISGETALKRNIATSLSRP